jgi:uncharacterized DUF497 family protein
LEFEWDETKRQEVILKHGVDMLYAALVFENDVLSRRDDRFEYGEDRVISIGLVDGECFVVVHTERKGVTRLITAWKGGRDDREEYQAGVARRVEKDEAEW